MSRRAAPSTNLLARVRAWFGFQQAELALYLGISPALAQHLESGRRAPTADVLRALLPLLSHLPAAPDAPATPAAGPPALPPGTFAPDAAGLDFRRRACLQQADRLWARAGQIEQRAGVAHHWARALPALLAAAAAGPDPTRAAWLADWLQRRARPLPVAAATRWHLLRARAAALEAEAAALQAALAGAGAAPG